MDISLFMNCTLCNTPLTNHVDEYFFICDNCGAYLKKYPFYLSPEKEKERYQKHQNNVNDIHYQIFTSPITHAILQKQSPNDLGLDYGCGNAPVISKQLMDKGYNVKLYDPFFYYNEDYLNFSYDYIFSCEVFEHFHSPKQEIEKLLSILKPNGYLYIMTHLYHSDIDFKNWYYRRDPTHVFIFTIKTIEYISEKFSLNIQSLTERLIIMKKR